MQRNYKISNLRVIAIILVVLGHSIILYSNKWNVFTTKYEVPVLSYIKDVINAIQMPLFFSLSGYLFSYKYANKYTDIVKDKFRRLMIPYCIVFFLYLVPIRVIINFWEPKNIINSFFMMDCGHLWYLPTLFTIFVLAFPIICCCKNKILLQIISAVGLYAISFLSYKVHAHSLVLNVMRYFVWFFYGYFICENEKKVFELCDNKKCKAMIIILLLVSLPIYLLKNSFITSSIISGGGGIISISNNP